MRKTAVVAIGVALAFGFMPVLSLSPAALAVLPTASANIDISPPTCTAPGCYLFTATYMVNVDPVTCPSGGTYTALIAVTPPGQSQVTDSETGNCGSPTPPHFGFPNALGDLHPVPGGDICTFVPLVGTWTLQFSGTTYAPSGPAGGPGGAVGTFAVTNTYTVNPCGASVPQFPLGMAALLALMLPLLLVLRKWSPAFRRSSFQTE